MNVILLLLWNPYYYRQVHPPFPAHRSVALPEDGMVHTTTENRDARPSDDAPAAHTPPRQSIMPTLTSSPADPATNVATVDASSCPWIRLLSDVC